MVRKLATSGGDSSSLLSAISDLETAIGNIPAGANLAPLEAAVANLRVVANTISTGVTDIETDLTTARTELATIQNSLADASTGIGAVQSDLADAGTEIGVVKANLAVVRTEVGTVQTDLTGASTDITAIQASLAIVDTALTSIQSALDSNVTNAIAAVQAAVDALPEGVDTAELNSAVTMLMSEISSVSTQVGTVKTVVDGTVTKVDSVKTVVDSTVTKVDSVKGVVDDTETKVDGVKTAVDSAETKVDGVKTVVDSTIDKVDDVKVVVDDAASKVDEVKVVVDGVPGNVVNARNHIEQYSNWSVEEGRIGEQPMIVQNGRWLEEDSIIVPSDIAVTNTNRSLFSDGTTIWLHSTGNSAANTAYALTLSTGARNPSKDIVFPATITVGGLNLGRPVLAYCDETHAWFLVRSSSSSTTFRVAAWRLSTRARDTSQDGTVSNTLSGINRFFPLCNGSYIWRTDSDSSQGEARTFPGLVLTPSANLDLTQSFDAPDYSDIISFIVGSSTVYASGQFSSDDPYELFAFNASTHGRDSCRDLRSLHDAGNRNISGMAITNSKLYVYDRSRKAIFAYELGTKKVGFGRIII